MKNLEKNSIEKENNINKEHYKNIGNKKSEHKLIGKISSIGKNLSKMIPYNYNHIEVIAFVGPSGTGKSFNAQEVAFKNGIDAIIDDGLLIKGNRVVGGSSAKAAKTKLETIRKALFNLEEEQASIRAAIKKEKIKSILILGTSDQMVEKIQTNLRLPAISNTIYINDIATKEEQDYAVKVRKEKGQHVVPVPTFEIKKDFSGILLSQFKRKRKINVGRGARSIIRPTFSYFGTYTIKDTVFIGIVKKIASDMKEIESVHKIGIYKDKFQEGDYLELDLHIVVYYGYNVVDVVKRFNSEVRKAMERTTAIHNMIIDVKVANIMVGKNSDLDQDRFANKKKKIKLKTHEDNAGGESDKQSLSNPS